MQLLGHADISVTMRYAHPSPETKRKAVEGLLASNKVTD
jgi:site-specific recombinase XerD